MSPDSDSLTDLDPLRDLDVLRHQAITKLAAKPRVSLLDLQTAASIAKSCHDARQQQAVAALQLRSGRSEQLRFWLPVATSLASVIILALTLWAQSRQFRQTAALQDRTLRAQLDASEDTAWRESIRNFSDRPGLIGSAAGVASLEQFMQSNRHAKDALRLAVALLGQSTCAPPFKILFEAAFAPRFTSAQGATGALDELIALNRQLHHLRQQLNAQGDELASSKGQLVPDSMPSGAEANVDRTRTVTRAFATQRNNALKDEVYEEQKLVSLRLISVAAKAGRTRSLDLSDTALVEVSLRNFDLADANLDGADLVSVDLQGADLSDARAENPGVWQSAWWKAERIAPPLLTALRSRYPFPRGTA